MAQFSERQFARFERRNKLPRGTRRRLAMRAAMRFAIENCDRYPNREAFEAAIRNHLQCGAPAEDEEYGSFILSFVIGPLISFLIGRLLTWVWENYRGRNATPAT